MDNFIEIHDGDFYLKLYLDQLPSFPAANFRRVMRLLEKHPEALERAGEYLRERTAVCRVEWETRSQEFVRGWRSVDARSRTRESRAKLSENKRLKKNLLAAKRLYEIYNQLLQIYEKQGGTHK